MLRARPQASEPGIPTPVLPCSSCVIFGTSRNFSDPQMRSSIKGWTSSVTVSAQSHGAPVLSVRWGQTPLASHGPTGGCWYCLQTEALGKEVSGPGFTRRCMAPRSSLFTQAPWDTETAGEHHVPRSTRSRCRGRHTLERERLPSGLAQTCKRQTSLFPMAAATDEELMA